MCSLHYQRWRKHGNPLHVRQAIVGVASCSIDECAGVVKARGWCLKHYTRWVRYKDPVARMPGEIRDGCRICPGCEQDLPLANYTANKTGRCKRCNADAACERRADPVVRQAVNEAARVYAEANRALMASKARDWRQRNPDRMRAQAALYRARKYANYAEPFKPLDIFERDGWMCGICREQIDRDKSYPDMMSASLDHVVPLSRGGSHVPGNCQASHLLCNVRKGPRIQVM